MSDSSTAAPETTTPDDKLERLERVVRSMGRENLELARSMQEAARGVASMSARMDELDLNVKGVAQTVWKAVQDARSSVVNAEEHYAVALRELEARVGAEMRSNVFRSCLQAVVPALDDLDLVLAHQSHSAAGEGSALEALQLVRQKFVDGLKTLGLQEVPVEEGLTLFDPALHQVCDRDVPAELVVDRDVPRGTVLFRRRAGFLLDGKPFRPAHVIVKT